MFSFKYLFLASHTQVQTGLHFLLKSLSAKVLRANLGQGVFLEVCQPWTSKEVASFCDFCLCEERLESKVPVSNSHLSLPAGSYCGTQQVSSPDPRLCSKNKEQKNGPSVCHFPLSVRLSCFPQAKIVLDRISKKILVVCTIPM